LSRQGSGGFAGIEVTHHRGGEGPAPSIERILEDSLSKEFRCRKCHRLLAKGQFKGFIELKCPKCGKMQIFTEGESNGRDGAAEGKGEG
jgi:phage FluMu protein Com